MRKKLYLSLLLTSLIFGTVGCDKEVPSGKRPGATKIEQIQNGDNEKKETNDTKKTENKKENNNEVKEVANIDNFLFIGDSMMNNLKPVILKDTPSAIVKGAGGKEATYFLKRLDSLPKNNINGIVVWIGVNGITNENNVKNTEELLSELASRYPGKKIYVMKVFPVGKNWSYGNMVADKMNPGILEFNKEIESYTKSNNIVFIDATKEFVDEEGYLIGSPDDLHLFNTEDNEKILEVVKSSISEN